MWEKSFICKFCKYDFGATELDVRHGNLQQPDFFVPDYQYYLICPQCREKLVLENIPSDVAVAVQERIHAENNESTDNQ